MRVTRKIRNAIARWFASGERVPPSRATPHPGDGSTDDSTGETFGVSPDYSGPLDIGELSRRESERVEWKHNVADVEDVVRTIVAFSNDFSNLGGGFVVCGAREGKDEFGFQKVFLSGLGASRAKEVEGIVLQHCRERVSPAVVPIIEEIPTTNAKRRVLVFTVPSTGRAHHYRDRSGSTHYFIRIGRETREARNGLLTDLLSQKGQIDPWDRRATDTATTDDLDPLILRDYLKEMGLWDPNKPLDHYISATERLSEFTPSLAIQDSAGRLRPRNFAAVVFAKDVTRLVPGAFSVFSIYPGRDRSEPMAEKKEITGTIIEQARRVIQLLDAESYLAFDKEDPKPNQIRFSVRALKEAVVNAIVHRDYSSDHPTRFTVFSNRIEISSPGGLPRSVNPERFRQGLASAVWRNQALAWIFNRLQFAQAEGQGIPTIIRAMRDDGFPDPVFEISDESVTCILPAHPRHEMMKELNTIETQMVLGNPQSAATELERLLESDPYNFRSIELYCEACLLLRTPRRVYDFLMRNGVDVSKLNPGTQIVLAEMLLRVEDSKVKAFASDLVQKAVTGNLEQGELKKIALAYRKLGDDEKAIEFIDQAMKKHGDARENSVLLEIRGKAKIDLAKKCMNTARAPGIPSITRGRAWDQCRKFLTTAEADLNLALQHVTNPRDEEYIRRDLDFLQSMKEIARQPKRHDGRRRR